MPNRAFCELEPVGQFFHFRVGRDDVFKRFFDLNQFAYVLLAPVFWIFFVKINCCRVEPNVVFRQISEGRVGDQNSDLELLSGLGVVGQEHARLRAFQPLTAPPPFWPNVFANLP